MMYLTAGERNDRTRARAPNNHAGKVLRLRDDGTVPPDNPFVGRAGFKPEIHTYGHRNPQGLTIHPETGQLWETEHGPQGGDELNMIHVVGGLAGFQRHRVVFSAGGPQGRETLLNDLKVRIRDVRQGPDGNLYLAVNTSPNGTILRLEPADAPAATSASIQ